MPHLETSTDMPDDEVLHDSVARFRDATEGRTMKRRTFLSMCAILGVSAAAARLTPAAAASDEIVLVNWGGDAVKAMKAAFVDPFLAKNPGAEVVIDGAGPATGKIKAGASAAISTPTCRPSTPRPGAAPRRRAGPTSGT